MNRKLEKLRATMVITPEQSLEDRVAESLANLDEGIDDCPCKRISQCERCSREALIYDLLYRLIIEVKTLRGGES